MQGTGCRDPEPAATQTSLGSRSPSSIPPPAPASAAPSPAEGRLLLQADLHGCLVSCMSSRDVRHSGITGIVAAATQQVLCIVTREDRLHGEEAGGRAGNSLPSGYSFCNVLLYCGRLCEAATLLVFAVVPKKDSVFRYEVPGGRLVTVNGEALCATT